MCAMPSGWDYREPGASEAYYQFVSAHGLNEPSFPTLIKNAEMMKTTFYEVERDSYTDVSASNCSNCPVVKILFPIVFIPFRPGPRTTTWAGFKNTSDNSQFTLFSKRRYCSKIPGPDPSY